MEAQRFTKRRLMAGMIDMLIVILVVNVLISEENFHNSDSFPAGEEVTCEQVCQAWKMIAYTFAFIPYGLVAEALFGRTLGKAVAGLRVERDGRRASFWRIAARNLLRLFWIIPFPGLGLMADAMMIVFTERNRRLGDLVTGTVVVRSPVRLPGFAAAT